MSNVGACESCGHQFRYDLIHNGFNDSAYGYCDLCGCTLLLSGWSKNSALKDARFRVRPKHVPERVADLAQRRIGADRVQDKRHGVVLRLGGAL